MTIIGHVLGWIAVCGLLWLSALCVVACILNADAVYAAFAVVFALAALFLARHVADEAGINV